MNTLLDGPDALVGVDAHGTVTAVNPAAHALLGVEAGDGLLAKLQPENLSGVPACPEGWPPRALRLPGSTRLPEQELWVQGRSGPVEVALTARVLRDSRHRLRGAVLSLRDLSPRRRLEKLSVELVSTVSHELRSPLASVKGYTATLLHRWDRFTDDDRRFMIEQVNHDADRVTRLINELLDVSRLETGRLKLRPEWIGIDDIVDGIVAKLAFAHPDAVVSRHFAADLPDVYADRDKVTQVLTNLIENAAKYGDPGTIRVRGVAGSGVVEVAVTNEGDGIPSDVLPRVFSKFFRAENRQGRPTGTGLGLYIAKGLARAHGGSLEVSSAVGEGTTFVLTLPLSGPQPPEPSAP